MVEIRTYSNLFPHFNTYSCDNEKVHIHVECKSYTLLPTN